MQKMFYPNQKTVEEAMQVNDPLLMCVSYDKKTILSANIDDSLEHHILLKQWGYSEMDIDNWIYRVAASRPLLCKISKVQFIKVPV